MNQILKIKFTQVDTLLRRINTVNQCRIYIFKDFIGFLKDIHIHHLVRDIILAQQTDGTRLHTQVHVFGHQYRFHFRIFGGKKLGCRQNKMIGLLRRKSSPYFGSLHLTGHHKQASQAFAQLHSFRENLVTRQRIQLTHKLTGIEINLLVSFLEFIQLLKHDKGKINIIFLEILQAIIVVKNNIGV